MIAGRGRRWLAPAGPSIAAAVLAAVVLLALGVAAGPVDAASAYKSCKLSQRDQDPPGEKPTYNLSLKRIGGTCTSAKQVMNAFQKCRSVTSYRCTKRLLTRWTCTAKKDSGAAGIFYATFTCKSGARRVKSTYQQNT